MKQLGGGKFVGFVSMKFFSSAVMAYRCFSTKCAEFTFKKKKNYRNKSEPLNPSKNRIKLTEEQDRILAAIDAGKSVFITGSAGTGKTFLLRKIIGRLRRVHNRSQIAVTASTGVAASAINGQTIHFFSGIRYAAGDCNTLFNMLQSDKSALKRWLKVRALVIDEISMISADFFDKLEYIARKVREEHLEYKDKRWGGIQLVVSGDFFQLPPILNRQQMREKQFAFEANCWASSFDMQVELTMIFRQSDDQLIKLLRGMRRGETDPEHLKLLEQCCIEADADPSVVQIYPRNEDVNRMNKKQMESLGKDVVVFRAMDFGKEPWKNQLKHGIAPDELELCVGARVMLSKNIDPWKKLVNGAAGTIVDFYKHVDTNLSGMCEKSMLPVVRFDNDLELQIEWATWDVMDGDKIVATRKQIPLILAWAISIHKCQGMTLDRLHTNLSKVFDYGMVYVALSRVKCLDGLQLSGLDPEKIKAHPKVLKFYQSFVSTEVKQDKEDAVEDSRSSSESSNLPAFK